MNDRLSKLAKAAAASMRGESIDPNWIYDESMALLEERDSLLTNALWHTLVDAACALNDSGEYALGGEIFEALLEHSRERRYPKIEFDALEGLAESWFYLGDHNRAFGYLDGGVKLAAKLNRPREVERFQESIGRYREGTVRFSESGGIKAPATSGARKDRRAHASSLIKQQGNRF